MTTGPSQPNTPPAGPWALPDFNSYPVTERVVAATPTTHGVVVTWSDQVITEHHRFVLREHSPDPITTHPVSREQQVQLCDLDADLAIVAAAPTADGALLVEWSHGPVAESVFHPGWLRAWAGDRPAPHALPPVTPWTAEAFDPAWLELDGPAVLDGGAEFDRLLMQLRQVGVAVITGLAIEPEMITRLPAMIGPVRPTNFGEVFDVRTRAVDITSNAYTDLALPVHTDLDTREYMPGLQFLWCMVNDASGGASRLSDAAAITRWLRDEHPAAFDALTTIPVGFVNKATDSDYRHEAPFLVVDDDGELIEARWSPWLRAPLRASIADAERFYAALRLALAAADSSAFAVTHRLSAGEMLAFDNRRLLHGRDAIDRSTGERWLRGCYVEREELDSRLRVRQRER